MITANLIKCSKNKESSVKDVGSPSLSHLIKDGVRIGCVLTVGLDLGAQLTTVLISLVNRGVVILMRWITRLKMGILLCLVSVFVSILIVVKSRILSDFSAKV